MKIDLSQKAYEKLFTDRDISPQNVSLKITIADIGWKGATYNLALVEPAEADTSGENFYSIRQDGINFLLADAVKFSSNELKIETREIDGNLSLIVYNANFAPDLDLKPEKYTVDL